ncbi:MAG TPA: outer membrane lipoprotein-sorting protein, partial [Terriglobales bacterium]|nr:outer membrane lipoprotein-sorting protein [Terriglobales bacterium]
GGVERRTDQNVNFMFYDGQPKRYSVDNPQNFLSKQLVVAMFPADLHGTAALNWRYRDPDKRDSAWAFVPALRRVRAVSPANRSDGFLGSDMSQDDGPFFDGKPEDFNWTLEGEVDQYRLVDPLSLKGQSNAVWLPQGGWRAMWDPDVKQFGYQEKGWQGIAWAPVSGALAKRKFYVLSAIPKDRYYLYGKIQLYIDKETYQGAWNRKFSWQGELLNTFQVMAFLPKKYTRPDGQVDYIQGSNMAFQLAENIKQNRATSAGQKVDAKAALDSRINFDSNFFETQAMSRFGK